MGQSTEMRVTKPNAWSSRATALLFASSDRISRSAPTRLLCRQESPADHVEIRQRGGNLQVMQVLGETSITDLLEAKHPLDHPDRVLNLCTHPRFALVLYPVHLIHPAATSVLAVGEVLRSRCSGMDHRRLPLITLITPHARLASVQQIRQSIDIRHVRRRCQDRVDQLRLAVDPDVRLHPEVLLLALGYLVHLRIALAFFVLGR